MLEKLKGQSRMENLEKLKRQSRMENLEKLTTLGTQNTGRIHNSCIITETVYIP